MELLFLLALLAAGVISMIGTLLWWFGIAWAAKKAISGASQQGPDIEMLLQQLTREIQSQAATGRRSPQLSGLMGQFNRQMRDLDAVGRARIENRAAELSSMAASAGIDWRG